MHGNITVCQVARASTFCALNASERMDFRWGLGGGGNVTLTNFPSRRHIEKGPDNWILRYSHFAARASLYFNEAPEKSLAAIVLP